MQRCCQHGQCLVQPWAVQCREFPEDVGQPRSIRGPCLGWGQPAHPTRHHLPHPCSPQEHPCTTGVDGGGSGRWSLSGKEGIVIYFFFPVESHTEMSENWTLFIGVRCLP